MQPPRALLCLVVLIASVCLSACLPSHAGDPSDGWLARARQCETHDNYAAVSPSGRYRGAFQFSRHTWNAVAKRVFPGAVGMDPAAAPPWLQDYLAKALYREDGPDQWPVCGYA